MLQKVLLPLLPLLSIAALPLCTDVLQGVILIIGSAVFLVVQRTELGGLPAAATFYRDPANAGLPNVALMRSVPPAPTIVAYFDFVFKVRSGALAGSQSVAAHVWRPFMWGTLGAC
jgi:Na+/proline symporter